MLFRFDFYLKINKIDFLFRCHFGCSGVSKYLQGSCLSHFSLLAPELGPCGIKTYEWSLLHYLRPMYTQLIDVHVKFRYNGIDKVSRINNIRKSKNIV